MKVCIKENEFNPSFISMYGEEKAKELGYTIFEVPQGYEDCAFADFDNNGFNIEKYNTRKSKEYPKVRIAELDNWFNTTYRYKYEKYTRLIALNKLDDGGVEPNEKLLALYEEAEDVRRQIQELEEG